MKVILLEDVSKLGQIGDEIEVKDGYARNYLLPRKYAVKSSKGALQVIEKKKKEKQRREQQRKEECEKIAEKIATISCTIPMESGEEDKLFGAVTTEMIASYFCNEGIELDKKNVILEEPIKALGVFNVDIWLHPEVKTKARIWVVKK